MLKKSASGVLASLRGSTYRSVRFAASLAAALPVGTARLGALGWAGENEGLFEHPEVYPCVSIVCEFPPYIFGIKFSRNLLGNHMKR
jgi:hypothetical protein